MSHISTYAAGNYLESKMKGGFNGYYTWARFGFNARLNDADLEILPEAYKDAVDLNDLMEKPNGWFVWLLGGEAKGMFFDLKYNSKNWRVLKRYLKDKGYNSEF